MTHEYYSANRNFKSFLYRFVQHDDPLQLIPSGKGCHAGVKMRSFCLDASEIKVKCKIKGFPLLKCFRCRCRLLSSAWLNGARLHLDLLLRLWRFHFLVADAWSDRQQRTAAVDGVEEVPRLLRDLSWIRSCGVRASTSVHITNIGNRTRSSTAHSISARLVWCFLKTQNKDSDLNFQSKSNTIKQKYNKKIYVPCLSVKWPFLFTVILELSMGPGGSWIRRTKEN